MYVVKRLPGNPIVRPDMPGFEGPDVCGPSPIVAPAWLPGRLGKYYLYFARHKGRRIRLAYADAPGGPWTVHDAGVLSLDETAARDHIASPDVHVDEARRLVTMYFHGEARWSQKTFFATSPDGLRFRAERRALGPFYFRVVRHRERYLAVAKLRNESGVLLRSRRADGGFRRVRRILPGMRHAALRLEGDRLHVFFSRIGDRPESILVSTIDLTEPPRTWTPSEPGLVLAPEEDWEGADRPLAASRSGPVNERVNQLRDPAILADGERLFLFYSVAGESGLAVAEIT